MNKLTVRLASEAAVVVPYALTVRWLFIPGAWERDTRAVWDWLESLDNHWYQAVGWIHRLLAKVWTWTREPERVWERMRAQYAAGGYDGDRDTNADRASRVPSDSLPPAESGATEDGIA